MKLDEVRFPVYVVHSEEAIIRDGLLWIDGTVVDDKNVEGETLGERRLRTPMKNLYDLKYQINDFSGLTKHRGRFYVDSNGKFFIYEKSKKADLKYEVIQKIERKNIATLVWVKGIPFPFEVPVPPLPHERYAGVLYINRKPSFLYELSQEKKKNTWRKI